MKTIQMHNADGAVTVDWENKEFRVGAHTCSDPTNGGELVNVEVPEAQVANETDDFAEAVAGMMLSGYSTPAVDGEGAS